MITVIRITIATTPATTPPAIETMLTDCLSSLVVYVTTQRIKHVYKLYFVHYHITHSV